MARELKIEQPFNLGLSLMMGQAFRWRELPPDFYGDGHEWFSGVLGENLIHIHQTDAGVEYRVGGPDGERDAIDADDELLRRYFRLGDDIEAIYASIARDPKMDTIMWEFPGLRLLRQDPWECMVSYICTANTGVPVTTKKVEAISSSLGRPLTLSKETRSKETRPSFPSPEQIATAGEGHLRELGVGKPAIYIVQAAAAILCRGLSADSLATVSYADAKGMLMDYSGVGNKIADCICLFSLDQLQAFPMDRWVWRAITEAYPEWGFPEKAEPTDRERREAAERARLEFGEYAGYANQYLFFWRRQFGEERLSFADRWHGKFRITPPDGRELDDEYLDDLRYEYLTRKYLS